MSQAPGSLAGRRIAISGASSGIGTAIARAVVAAGGRVAVIARRADRLQQLQDELGSAVVPCVGDVTDLDGLAAVVERGADALGGLDGVVANAGQSLVGTVKDGSPQGWASLIALNLVGSLAIVHEALQFFPDSGTRDVLVVGSTGGITPLPGLAAYAASKRGLEAACESMRLELAPVGVRVTLLVPGDVATEVVEHGVYQTDIPPGLREGKFVEGTDPLSADDVGAVATFMLAQPAGVALHSVVMRPTGQLKP